MEDITSGHLSAGAGIYSNTFSAGFFTVATLRESRQAADFLVTTSETQTDGTGDSYDAGSRTFLVGLV